MMARQPRFPILVPIVSFISIIVLGVIFATRILPEQYQLAMILISIVFAFFVSAVELRSILRMTATRSKLEKQEVLSEEEREIYTAALVAEIFEEDIPKEEYEKKLKEIKDEEISE